MYASKSAKGFFSPKNHGDSIPADAVEITQETYRALLDGQSAGKSIEWDDDGRPYLAERPAPTAEQVRERRLVVYRAESDNLKLEAEHDAIVAGSEPDYTAWLAKVAEIKARFPLPEQ